MYTTKTFEVSFSASYSLLIVYQASKHRLFKSAPVECQACLMQQGDDSEAMDMVWCQSSCEQLAGSGSETCLTSPPRSAILLHWDGDKLGMIGQS